MTFVSPPSATYSIELMSFFLVNILCLALCCHFSVFSWRNFKSYKNIFKCLKAIHYPELSLCEKISCKWIRGKEQQTFWIFFVEFFLLIVSKNIYKKNSSIVPLLRRPGMVFGVTKKCKCKFYKMRNSIKNKIPNNQIACREKKNIKVFIFLITYLISRENLF